MSFAKSSKMSAMACCAWSFFMLASFGQASFLAKGALPKSREYCADLTNRGTHSTVDVEVGTPGQVFSVVADTGSNSLIVPSCTCNENNRCETENRCFRGTNASSTFLISGGEQPLVMTLSFGSGDIQAALASDVASVDGLKVTMNHSLLLMIDQALSFGGPFEGILGLGLPQRQSMLRVAEQSEDGSAETATGGINIGDIVQRIIGAMAGGDDSGGGIDWDAASGASSSSSASFLDGRKATYHPSDPKATKPVEKQVKHDKELEVPAPQAFLERAGIGHFSMCFNDQGVNGTLRMGGTQKEDALGSIGEFHWGLDFRGITVGDRQVPVKMCSLENMTEGQETPCGAIPDSGTTAIMGPKDQLSLLMDSICDQWERCSKNHSLFVEAQESAHQAVMKTLNYDPFGIDQVEITKSMVLQLLLQDCGAWLTEEEGVNELPTLSFKVVGANGQEKTLDLTGWAYVIEMEQDILEQVYADIPGFGKIPVGANSTGRTEKTCSLSVGDMGYSTQKNGPVWILGTPFFYEFSVGYDLKSKPPSISFTSVKEEPCGTCNPVASLLTHSGKQHEGGKHSVARPRQVDGPWRMPHIDVSKPL